MPDLFGFIKREWKPLGFAVALLLVLALISYVKQKHQERASAQSTQQAQVYHQQGQSEAQQGAIEQQHAKDLSKDLQAAIHRADAEAAKRKALEAQLAAMPHDAVASPADAKKDEIISSLETENGELREALGTAQETIKALGLSVGHYKTAYEKECLARECDHISAQAAIKAAEERGARIGWVRFGEGVLAGGGAAGLVHMIRH